MPLKVILTFCILMLAVGVWSAAVSVVRTNARAKREWHRVIGKVSGLRHPERPEVVVEEGIEYAPPLPPDKDPAAFQANERIFQLDGDAGLRILDRVELLVDPVTKRARVAGKIGLAPFLLALLGLLYVAIAAGFLLVTWTVVAEPGQWVYYQSPPWKEPAILSARFATWPILERVLGLAIGLFGAAMVWTSPATSLPKRAAIVSVVLLVTGFLGVTALERLTYRLEADTTCLRQSSALGWQKTPWEVIRHGVDETTRWMGKRSSRSLAMLDHVTRSITFTDEHGSEVARIGEDLRPDQLEAVLKYVIARTGVQPEKRVRQRELLSRTQ